MNCKYPVKIYDKTQGKFIEVPCGKCIFCCSANSRDWQNRLKKEFNHEYVSYFITLTYDEENLPYLPLSYALSDITINKKYKCLRPKDYNLLLYNQHNTNYSTDDVPSLCPRDICNFIKRLRQNLIRINENFSRNIKIKYYAIGEYGPTTFRPHYHCIIGFRYDNLRCSHYEFMRNLVLSKRHGQNFNRFCSLREYVTYCVEKSWQQGFIKVDPLNDERIQYVTKYLFKFTDKNLIEHFEKYKGLIRPFKRSSNGIGESFVITNKRLLYNQNKLVINNVPNRLPRYMRNKLIEYLTEEETNIYKQRYQLTDENVKEFLLKKLHKYQSTFHLPYNDNLEDISFQKWLQESHEAKENSIKNYMFKKRKL